MTVEHGCPRLPEWSKFRRMPRTFPSNRRQSGNTRPDLRRPLFLTLLIGWLVLGGCGVKGPPVPARQPAPLPAIADLNYRVVDRRVRLTWHLASPLDPQAATQASFIVRRSRTALDDTACENCPRVFERVGTLPYVQRTDDAYALNLGLEAGYRYAFTVHLETDGMVGPDSNPVRFDYPADDIVVPAEAP